MGAMDFQDIVAITTNASSGSGLATATIITNQGAEVGADYWMERLRGGL
jgi:NAD(P)-dependent dehydrogenase (short-subunit alcohol dehydrogenase family)